MDALVPVNNKVSIVNGKGNSKKSTRPKDLGSFEITCDVWKTQEVKIWSKKTSMLWPDLNIII